MRLFLPIIALLFSASAFAQTGLESLFADLRAAESDSAMLQANERFKLAFEAQLQEDEAFTNGFDELSGVGKVMSDDGKLRIISWNYRLPSGAYGYNCYFLLKNRKNKPHKLFSLQNTNAYKPADNKTYKPDNWYGSLYYSAVKQKDKYLLLGYSVYNDFSKVKVIDALDLDGKNPVLGSKIFKPYPESNKTSYRVVFEYSANADMNLSYDKELKSFIFDHLSPELASLEGAFQYYGPDFSVDALQLKKKFWTLRQGIDYRDKF